MPAGSYLPAFKTALDTTLRTRLGSTAAVSYSAPATAAEAMTATGALDTVWIADAVCDVSIPHYRSGPLTADEVVTVTVVAQALRPQGSQAEADEAAAALLRAVLGVVLDAHAPGTVLGVAAADGVMPLHIIPLRWRYVEGFLAGGSNGHGARYEIDIEARARLTYT